MISSNELFQWSPIPMWIVDAQTSRFLEVNEAAIKVFGYTRAEFLLLSEKDISDAGVLINLKLTLDAAVQASIFRKEVQAYVKKDGKHILAELEQNQIKIDHVTCFLVLVIDITLRVESEISMYESQERLDVLSKATSDTIWDYALQSETVVWNKGVSGVFGHMDIVANTTSAAWFREQVHPEDRARIAAGFFDKLANKTPRWKDEFRLQCADGSYKYVLNRCFLVFDGMCEPVRVIGAVEDVSKRKEEEHWSKLLESVVINTTDGVVITDTELEGKGPKIIYVNTAFERMTGRSKEELVGQAPLVLSDRWENKPAISKLSNAVEKKHACDIEVVCFHKSGREYWLSMNVTPVTDGRGEVSHWISILRDITDSRKYLMAIEAQNRKFREIAWIQSHLVRAPLARVMGLVDLLSHHTTGDEADLLLKHLSSSAKELDAIIIDIADRTPAGNIN